MFSMSRTIPTIGSMEDGSVMRSVSIDAITSINLNAPPKKERPLLIEESHEQVKDFLEEDTMM